jgi:hypothetical protein
LFTDTENFTQKDKLRAHRIGGCSFADDEWHKADGRSSRSGSQNSFGN